ncbi:FecR domain-containing protein [Draconibacterium sp. IB214405]|uniref:FecR family protein n=1 Tax=Draconibacterium sp. IB214405 TaxID=3097352 RepID=UPI002A0E40DE|nr:FecR domain-containing protein [Draconibacterium sp. IB214405]MDX8340685.1 FecR domain-containing protein [Draconibacterium sp. IB214405]
MTNTNTNIENLLSKSVFGGLSEEEKSQLDKWISESEENAGEYEAYQQLWKKSEELVVGDSIDVEASLLKTKEQISFTDSKKRWLIIARQVAAVLLVSITISGLYTYFSKPEKEHVVYQDISTAFGTQTEFELADGTKVWLNSGSHIHYPNSFNNMDERRIELVGEAFFEVTKNAEKPFIVETSALDIKVLGTAFNVSAYTGSENLTVALKEGKVSLHKAGLAAEEDALVSLVPNEVAVYNNKQNDIVIHKEKSLNKYNAWKDGRIVFFEDGIETVVQKLENWYNVDIEVADNELNELIFTATFIDEPLEQILNWLSISSPINYSITPATKNEDGIYSKRKIIIKERNNR